MFVKSSEINKSSLVGSKALRLKELQDAGFSVPPFVVLPTDSTGEILEREDSGYDFANDEIGIVLSGPYAVRSAALAEDGKKTSNAGKFMTVLDVDKDNLFKSIIDVAQDAREKSGDVGSFSIIVQEFVDADYSGVIFSRNPLGGVEMVLEFNQGLGESVVGGKDVSQIIFLNKNASLHKKDFAFIEDLAEIAERIEEVYDWPQDIEWAVKGGEVYVLQTRPITNITELEWRGIKYLNQTFADKKDYLFEQTTLAETFNRPRTLAYSILKSLYIADGPIDKVYKKMGCVYVEGEQMRLLGNELYVNKQSEVKSLLPSFGYFKYKSSVPRFESFSGLFTTINNLFRLRFLSFGPYKKSSEQIENLLNITLAKESSFSERWDFFLKHYSTVFEVNLSSQKAVTKLEALLGKDVKYMSSLLYSKEQTEIVFNIEDEVLIGNSLSIDDASVFRSTKMEDLKSEDSQFEEWWKSLPDWKRQGLQIHIDRARQYTLLREQARWASVRLISHLRQSVVVLGEKYFPEDVDLIYFTAVDELLRGNISKEKCLERKKEYGHNESMSMPARVASFSVTDNQTDLKNIGLSPGIAKGVLVNIKNIDKVQGPKILHTKILSPDIAEHIEKIEGIITEQGGLLSHMAIVAREVRVPVVVSVKALALGSEVSMDGFTGYIDEQKSE